MAKRTDSQKTGSLGQRMVELEIERSSIWVARNQNEDFGIDLEIELATPELSGKIIKAQIKTHQSVESKDDFIYQRLSKSFLRYVFECRIPILLIIVSTSTSEIWYTWLQKWLLDTNNRTNIYNELASKTLVVNIHKNSLLQLDLKRDIICIATWQNDTQKIITLHDLAKLALELYDDKLSEVLFSYLETLEKDNQLDQPDIIVDRVVELGTAIWATYEGNKRSQQMFDFVRRNGHKLKREHIAKLVLRGEAYSRTGINALSVLYREFSQHALSLKLPEYFKNLNEGVHYYCVLRERNIDKNGFWPMDVEDFRVGDFTIDDPKFLNDIFDKMANRGDSAILDYLEYKPA